MKKKKVKELKEKLKKFIPNPTKQQWRKYKDNYKKGLV